MEIPSRGLSLIAVALSSGHVLIFDDKNVVDCFLMDNPVSAMKFGKFGREDNTLVLVTVRNFQLRWIMKLFTRCFTLKDGWKPPHEDPEKNRPLWRPGDRGQPTQHTG